MEGEVVKFPPSGCRTKATSGSAGIATQVPGAPATVSSLSNASGGISSGNLVQRDIK